MKPDDLMARVLSDLEVLGHTPTNVAAALHGMEVTGAMESETGNPISVMLMKLHGLRTLLRNTELYCYDREGVEKFRVYLPSPVVKFMRRFDGGQYPALVAAKGYLTPWGRAMDGAKLGASGARLVAFGKGPIKTAVAVPVGLAKQMSSWACAAGDVHGDSVYYPEPWKFAVPFWELDELRKAARACRSMAALGDVDFYFQTVLNATREGRRYLKAAGFGDFLFPTDTVVGSTAAQGGVVTVTLAGGRRADVTATSLRAAGRKPPELVRLGHLEVVSGAPFDPEA